MRNVRATRNDGASGKPDMGTMVIENLRICVLL